MTKDQPLDHIARAGLPWRDQQMTECGRMAADIAGNLIDRGEFRRRINQDGKQRTAFTVCMTCANTSDQYARVAGTWEKNPASVLWRELEGVGGKMMTYRDDGKTDHINNELRAIAALVNAHRDEFDGYMQGVNETVNLADVRKQKRAR